jgi:hypothetical protein
MNPGSDINGVMLARRVFMKIGEIISPAGIRRHISGNLES